MEMTSQPQSPPLPSNLSRVLDPRVPSNLLILIFSVVVTLGAGGYQLASEQSLLDSVIFGLGAGVFTFLAWSIGREIDPDHNLTAYVAAVLAVLAIFNRGLPDLLATFSFIPLLRVVNRTTGLPPRLTDALALVVLAGLTTAVTGYWMIGIAISLAFLFDALLPQPNRPDSPGYALAAIFTTLGAALLFDPAPETVRIDTPLNAALILMALGYLIVVIRDKDRLRSVGDWTGTPLNHQRVRAGQLLAVGTVVAVLLWGGMHGLIALTPVWAALAGIIARRVVQFVRPAP